MNGLRKRGLLDLPSEVLRLIAEQLYDPLVLTQQDRLTWGIFSTVDMSPTRQAALDSLIEFGWTCRRVRKEVKVVLFRCIRVTSVESIPKVVQRKDDWASYVKSIIIDLNMFDQPDDPDLTPRSCWRESALLISLLQALPNLEHLSFFADQSDDSTLVLAFATLIPHPSLHLTPPSFLPSTQPEVTLSGRSSPYPLVQTSSPLPLASRIRSFGWRQRSRPPTGYEDFSTASTFVSTFHLIRHAHRLEYLVLDADMDKIRSLDITNLLAELRRRKAPTGEALRPCALTLCGPIKEWGQNAKGVLESLVKESGGHVGELFLDRPLAKSTERHVVDREIFLDILSPLQELPLLRLLQVGSYCFPRGTQVDIARRLAVMLPTLRALAVNGDDNDTTWWGIWREEGAISIHPLAEGDLKKLEGESRDFVID